MKKLITPFLALLALIILPSGAALAQDNALPADEAFVMQTEFDGEGMWQFRFTIAPGYYLYRENFQAVAEDGTILPLITPPGEVKEDPNFGSVEVHYTSVVVSLPAPPGESRLTWQGCKEDSICYPPQSQIVPATDPALIQPAAPKTSEQGDRPDDALRIATDPGLLNGLAHRGGTVLVLAGFFGFGLMLAFTPCVFPMIPIVAGMVAGAGTTVSARRGLGLSAVYVFAMALAFAGLGVFAAWSGQNMQVALQSPLVLMATAGLFVILALASFGLFELALPQALTGRLSSLGGRRGSVTGAAVLGVTSALIIGPCVTAPLAGALIYIAQTGDLALGAAALFALGLGQGLPLLAVGAFGPRILPRAGAWMNAVRMAFGVMFLGFAIWLLGRVLPGPVILALWAALLVGTGTVLMRGNRNPVWAGFGAVLLLGGAVQGIGAGLGAGDPFAPLSPLSAHDTTRSAPTSDFMTVTTPAGLDQALNGSDAPALVYVTADWCTVCRSIEQGPLADPAVLAALAPMARIKVDVTDFGVDSQALLDRLVSVGPPTMVFLDARRTEATGTRLIGDTDSTQLLNAIAQVAR